MIPEIKIRRAVVALLMLTIFPLTVFSTTVVRVDRATHDGFELVIVHCDSLPQFTLEYDRVAGYAELRLEHGRVSRNAAKSIRAFKAGGTIRNAVTDPARGSIRFRTTKPVHIRDYLVTGPAALILDFSSAEDAQGRLPFELDREGYLRLGSRAEYNGRLELALDYVEHVRGWEGSDIALTHRAGVIEQRLGRWDAALETLGESARIAEFAADAHARRTMIYLAKGDTVAMGNEWANFFHGDLKKAPQEADAIQNEVDTTSILAEQSTVQPAANTKRIPFKLPTILRAGSGDSGEYLYFGWGFLVVGLISLIGLLVSGKRDAVQNALYGAIDISIPPAGKEAFKVSAPGGSEGGYAELYRTAPQPPTSSVIPSVPKLAEIPPAQIIASSSEGSLRRTHTTRRERVPVDEIITLAEDGKREAEIAHQLMVGRDEVSMVLNLARLARRSAVRQNN